MEMELQILVYFLLLLLVYYIFGHNRHNQNHRLPPSPQPRLPIIGHMHLLGPLLHQSLHRLSLRYGPLFSLYFGSVPCVFASSPYFAKQLLQTNELSFNCRIESIAVKRLTYESSLAFAPYGDYWRFIKKLSVNELLGSRGTNNNLGHLRAQECHGLLRLLAQKAKACEAVNVTEELLKLTNNIISRMVLGEAEEAMDVVRDVTTIFGEFNVSDFIWLFKKVDLKGFRKRTEDLFQRFDSFVERVLCKREQVRKNNKLMENRENNGTNTRDFLDILLDLVEDENSEIEFSRVHVKGLIMDFFTAGTDTTAISIEWALVELIKKPLLLQRAREEIDNIVGKSRLVQESDCVNLPYLQAIVKEAFRLHPPVPLITRKCVANCKIDDYVIPKDALVFVNFWAIGRDPNYWVNPLEFRPERFLKLGVGNSNELIDVRGQHFQLLPFGSGRRMCPGVTFAMHDVPAILGAIIQCFDFNVVDPNGKVMNADDIVIDMDELPGLTAPRAQKLVCIPVERSNLIHTI